MVVEIKMVVHGAWVVVVLMGKEHEGTFQGAGNVLHLDLIMVIWVYSYV